MADAADWVSTTVPDNATPDIINHVHWRPDQPVLYCSGASECDLLDATRHAEADTASFHPLFLFIGLPDNIEQLGGAPITIDADAPRNATFANFVLRLGCMPLEIRAGQRAVYHADANCTASFLLCVLHEAITLWGATGINRDATVAAI